MYRTTVFLFFVAVLLNVKYGVCKVIEIKLKQGELSGKVEKTFWNNKSYFAFRGIPYAKPPSGDLRFKAPEPLRNWEGTKNAYENKPTCPQFSSKMRNNEPVGFSGSEDCLYISVYTPNLEAHLPVVVFDYNDNFRIGFNGSNTYSPDFFVEEDVIVVTISHRLGLFGYLTTNDNVIPANNGIRDVILGLQWVNDNIKLFGGDPTRITLMGNAGGGALTNILLYSEKAKGLFSAAIIQSGTAFETKYFFGDPVKKAFQLGKALNITTEDSQILLEELQKVDSEKLLLYEGMVFDSSLSIETQIGSSFPFIPIVEGEHDDAVIPTIPDNSKIVNDVPIIIGLTSREGLDIASHLLMHPKTLDDMLTHVNVQLPIRTGFRFDPNSTVFLINAARDVNEFYYKDGYLHINNLIEYSTYLGDTQHVYAIDYAAKKMAKELKSPVYYYLFDFRGHLNQNSESLSKYSQFPINAWGAIITDDICYLHLCSRIKKNYAKLKKLISEPKEIKTLKKMVQLWTNFVKIRNPTPENMNSNLLKGIFWKPIDKHSTSTTYLHIENNLRIKENPMEKRIAFWNSFVDKYRKMAIDGIVQDEEKKDIESENRIKPLNLKNDYISNDDDDLENFEFEPSPLDDQPLVKVRKVKKEKEVFVESVQIVNTNHTEL